ncbi:glycoside hydrolase family 38 N-terminal domain-containing protein [Paenibacillus eucommiae]|uniref:Alpha-mannosidase n=1 Tax=Paenibacillus eucommiae TaxID=1355755 RepID=A0ABS4J4S2_9BACL|nr:glycoside hydrolase family 38 C-terminal domain-containing protein [Paenibacillus eucommiae]MBP1994285.1 alpha-mannosidase [Paenibacillus eucommiae]
MKVDILEAAKVKEIHIMPYSHQDFAWGHSREWHIRRYLLVFVEMLEIMRTNKNFTWMIDNAVHSLIPFIKQYPEKMAEMKDLVKEGRLYVANGGYSLARSTYVGEETFIRNMVAGRRFFQKQFDLDNIDFFYNADVGCGHSQLPQILQLGGHKYYRFQRPEDALDAKGVPKQFLWKGLDGSQVLVSRGSYGGFVEGRFTNKDYVTEWETVKQEFFTQELADKVDSLLMTDIVWLNYGCDDCRPLRNLYDESIQVIEFVEEWNKREELKLIFSTPTAYFAKLEQTELPVHQGVLDPSELAYNAPIRGNHSMWRMRSELDRLIVKAEGLATMAFLTGVEYPYGKLEMLWNQLFEITGHAIEWINGDDFELLYGAATGAKMTAICLIRELCEEIAYKIQCAQEPQYVVFNTLPWARTEMVELHITNPLGMEGFDLRDSVGQKVNYQIVNVHDEYINRSNCEYSAVDIIAEVEVPATGYAMLTAVSDGTLLADKVQAECIDAAAASSDSGSGTASGSASGTAPASASDTASGKMIVNNGILEVTFDKGAITKIRETATGRMLQVTSSSRINGMKFVQTEATASWISSWDQVDEFRPIPKTWEWIEKGPLRWIYRVNGTIGSSQYRQDIRIQSGERAIGFDLELDSAGDESGYFAVDFAADPDTYLYADIPFGVEERNLSEESYGSVPESSVNYNAYERGWPGQFYAKSWAMFQSGEMPVAVVSENCSIYYNFDPHKHVVSLLLNRRMPSGNRKHTHPSLDGKGIHHFKYHMYVPEEKEKFAEVSRFSKMKTQRVDTVPKYNDESVQRLQQAQSFVEIDCEHVIVSGFYMEDNKILLRLYESEGRSSTIRIRTHFNFTRARVVDFVGDDRDPLWLTDDIDGRYLSCSMKPWQIVTMQFEI